MLVVAGALAHPDGCWLMLRRPEEKHHGDLWEFPGGKVEDTEIPAQSLIRELHEELGIGVHADNCTPFSFAEEQAVGGRPAIVILLYIVRDWDGIPRALEGGKVGWFRPEAIPTLAKPPLDRDLAARLFAGE